MNPPPDDAASPPPGPALLQLISARWISQAITAAARLGIADAVGDHATPVNALARTIGADAVTLARLLRALASVGIFAADDAGRYGHTPLSALLRADVPGSLRGMAMYMGSPASIVTWCDLDTSIRTGEPAFRRAHGKSFFEHLEEHPDEARAFDHAMHGVSATEIPAALTAYDFGRYEAIVDVGGGDGTLLTAILDQHPRLRGVVYDLAHVVEHGRTLRARGPHAARLSFVAGSFFEAVPAGGDAYVLKHILHDWSDELALRILRHCRSAMAPGARLLVLEAVLLPGNDPHFGKLLDLEMLALTEGGRERTEAELRDLLARAGFRLERVVPTAAPTAVVEAVPV